MLIHRHFTHWMRLACAGVLCLFAGVSLAQDVDIVVPPPLEVLISVADQKLVLLRDGGVIGKYRVSTSRFGIGDSYGSYKTPLGKLKVCDKIGGELPSGAVIKHRSATGEVIAPNAPGRDPIVTRVMWLEGTEQENSNAKARGIYIHGTPEEGNLGKPVSWGCIRMRSEDVIELYDQVTPGTPVTIIADRLPRLHKWKPAPPPEIEHVSVPPETLAKADPKVEARPAAKQAAQPAQPAVIGEKLVTPKVAALAPSSHNAPTANFSDDSQPAPKEKSNPEAWKAMKGSILMSGLPSTAPKTAASDTLDNKTKLP